MSVGKEVKGLPAAAAASIPDQQKGRPGGSTPTALACAALAGAVAPPHCADVRCLCAWGLEPSVGGRCGDAGLQCGEAPKVTYWSVTGCALVQ